MSCWQRQGLAQNIQMESDAGQGFAPDRQAAFHEGQQQRRDRERVEGQRRQALRTTGVDDNDQYIPADWDAPHGNWLVAVPELREVPVPDVVTGRAPSRSAAKLSQERRAAVEVAAEAMQGKLAAQANDVIDELEADSVEINGADGGGEPHVEVGIGELELELVNLSIGRVHIQSDQYMRVQIK